jgi:hypothetical protein
MTLPVPLYRPLIGAYRVQVMRETGREHVVHGTCIAKETENPMTSYQAVTTEKGAAQPFVWAKRQIHA